MLNKHLWISHHESALNPVLKRRVEMKRLLLVVLMVLAGMSLYSCATTSSLTSIPLPENVQIVPPDPNLPPEIRAFSGKWSGSWEWQNRRNNDGVDAILIVEKIINEQQAMVVYATGTAEDGRHVVVGIGLRRISRKPMKEYLLWWTVRGAAKL